MSSLQRFLMSSTLTLQRPEAIKVDAQDITGAKFSVNLSHLPARVFQHEFDHLEARSIICCWTITNKFPFDLFNLFMNDMLTILVCEITIMHFINLQGILFFDRMTAEVVDSIRTELQVSNHGY